MQALVLNSLSYLGRILARYQVYYMTYQLKIKVILILSRTLNKCLLLNGNTKKETDTDAERGFS